MERRRGAFQAGAGCVLNIDGEKFAPPGYRRAYVLALKIRLKISGTWNQLNFNINAGFSP
jgi:hypothetical protein